MSKTYEVVCHFAGPGINKIKVPGFREALQLAQSDEYRFQEDSIRSIGLCEADEDLSRRLRVIDMPEERKE